MWVNGFVMFSHDCPLIDSSLSSNHPIRERSWKMDIIFSSANGLFSAIMCFVHVIPTLVIISVLQQWSCWNVIYSVKIGIKLINVGLDFRCGRILKLLLLNHIYVFMCVCLAHFITLRTQILINSSVNFIYVYIPVITTDQDIGHYQNSRSILPGPYCQ